MDPPAYTPTTPAPATGTRRTIEDTRALILANASIIKKYKDYEPIELVIGKTKSPADIAALNQMRSFTSQTSNVTIRINDTPAAGSGSSSTPERRASNNDAVRTTGRHFAVLVYRTAHRKDLEVLLQGEPQDSVEEALEWMLDKTEKEISAVLVRNGVKVE